MTVGLDFSPSRNADPGPKKDIGFDVHVFGELGIVRQPHRLGGNKSDAGEHQFAAPALLPETFRDRQLVTRVDAQHLVLIAFDDRSLITVGARQLDGVGQIVLALGVVVANAAEKSGQVSHAEGDHAGIAQIDLAFAGTCVLVLADCDKLVLAVGDQPPVARRIAGAESQDCDAGAEIEAGAKPGDRLGANERCVGVEHDHVAVMASNGASRGEDGVRGAALLGLDKDFAGGDFGLRRRRDRFHVRPDDGCDFCRALRQGQHVASMERPATLCRTFGCADFIRVPLPAASTTLSSLGVLIMTLEFEFKCSTRTASYSRPPDPRLQRTNHATGKTQAFPFAQVPYRPRPGRGKSHTLAARSCGLGRIRLKNYGIY